jgi:hypothetical protein
MDRVGARSGRGGALTADDARAQAGAGAAIGAGAGLLLGNGVGDALKGGLLGAGAGANRPALMP